jgi:hypothetical protein
MRDQTGQALLEFALFIPLILIAVLVSALLFQTEWNRTRCASLAFRAAHQALRSETSLGISSSTLLGQVQVEKTESGVRAHARCGEANEEVLLPDLEHAQW